MVLFSVTFADLKTSIFLYFSPPFLSLQQMQVTKRSGAAIVYEYAAPAGVPLSRQEADRQRTDTDLSILLYRPTILYNTNNKTRCRPNGT